MTSTIPQGHDIWQGKVVPEETAKDRDNFIDEWEHDLISFDTEKEKREKLKYNLIYLDAKNGKEKSQRMYLSECLVAMIQTYQYIIRSEKDDKSGVTFEYSLKLHMYLNWARREHIIKPTDGVLNKLRDLIEENTREKFRADTAETKVTELKRDLDSCKKALNGGELSSEDRERLK